MADIDFKNSVNADTAYVDGHKVKLIAVPDGSLELPISANDEYGYVVDASDKKHRVLLTAFLEGDPDFKSSATADTAYMTVNGQKVKVRLGARLNGTQYLSNSANVNDCYTEDDDGNKHRTILVATPTGTLELPTSETDDSAYVIDGNGKKHKVRLFAVIQGNFKEITISGIPPLQLLGAVADSLTSLKAFGGTKENYGIPTEYTQIDYATKKGTASVQGKFNTGIRPTADDVKIEMKVKIGDEAQASGQTTVGSFYACQSRASANSPITGLSGSSSSNGINGNVNGQLITSSITRIKDHIDLIIHEYKNGSQTLYVKDLTTNTEDTQTGTYTFAAPTKNLFIFGNTTTTNNLNNNNAIYYCKIWESGTLVFDAVPVIRNSDNLVGLYDKVSETFIEPIVGEGGGFEAGAVTTPTPSDPMDIYCNNGKISVLDHTNWNVITNPDSETGKGMFINTSGVLSKANDRGAGVFIPVTVGKKYTVMINRRTVDLGTILRYGQSNNSEPPSSSEQLLDWYRGTLTDGMMISFTAKRPYFVMQLSANLVEATGGIDNSIEVIEASGDNETIAITDENNTTVCTATANNIFAINTYKDMQEIITGATTHKVGVIVLDGTESFSLVSGYTSIFRTPNDAVFPANFASNPNNNIGICSHFKIVPTSTNLASNIQNGQLGWNTNGAMTIKNDSFTTVAQFKSWLAAQYAAGTPVIVVYPLATEYEEPAPIAQAMTVVDGDNTVSLTQQGMAPLELEATYTAGVSVTITEIENANIGNDVDVVIA